MKKVRMAEDLWNSRNPEKVVQAYSKDSYWRNREQRFQGHTAIKQFLTEKWSQELEYRLIKQLWAFHHDHIAVRFIYEWHDTSGQWFRSSGNELWAFDTEGRMFWRDASINNERITATERRFLWPLGPRPADHPGLSSFFPPETPALF